MMIRIAIIITYVLVTVFAALGIAITFRLLSNPSIGQYLFSAFEFNSDKTDLMSKIGDYFGGYIGTLFAITSTLLILISLIKANIDTHKTNIANIFFKMLEFHHSNVSALEITSIYKSTSKKNGRRAFVTFTRQLFKIYTEVVNINKSLHLELTVNQLISVSFSSFYHGIDNESITRLQKKIMLACPNLTSETISNVTMILMNRKSELKDSSEINHTNIEEGSSVIQNSKRSLNIGITNETSLSAYFSNIYQAIKLIDDDKYFTKQEKYNFIQILKSQLSVRERIILFAYIMSPNGKQWISNRYIAKYDFFNLDAIPDDTTLTLREIYETAYIDESLIH